MKYRFWALSFALAAPALAVFTALETAPAQPVLRLGSVSATPGETDLWLPVELFPEEGTPIENLSMNVSYDPAVLLIDGIGGPGQNEVSQYVYYEPLRPGTFGVFLWFGPEVSAASAGVVTRLSFCVLVDAAPGVYPITLKDRALYGGGVLLMEAYCHCDPGSMTFPVIKEPGTLKVSGDPISGSSCHDSSPPRHLLRMGSVTAAPGETDLSVPIELFPLEGTVIQGWSMVVSYDPTIMAVQGIEETREADQFFLLENYKFLDPGTFGAMTNYSLFGKPDSGVTPANAGAIALVRFCVFKEAGPGVYPLNLAEYAERFDPGAFIATALTSEGKTHYPALEPGTLTVAGNPVSGNECKPLEPAPPPPPPPPPPGPLNGTFKLGDVSASPGASATVPFFLQANYEVAGFSFSIDFDETLLQITSIEEVFNGVEHFFIDNKDNSSGSGGVDEGYLLGAVIFGAGSPYELIPRDAETEVLSLHIFVKENASAGTTEITFIDGGQGTGRPVRNILTLSGVSVEPLEVPATVLIPGRISIVGDGTAFRKFIRGDANGDLAVDIADAQDTLYYLFLGSFKPACMDAADANDDGDVDISDPIFTLKFLFLGGIPLPSPSGIPNYDPTPDFHVCRQGDD